MNDFRWLSIMPGNTLRFEYTNWKGITEIRTVVFIGVNHGSNEWYPEPQWFLFCHCTDRHKPRSFALSKIDASKLEIY